MSADVKKPATSHESDPTAGRGEPSGSGKRSFKERFLSRWMDYETPNSDEKSLSSYLIRRDLIRCMAGVALSILCFGAFKGFFGRSTSSKSGSGSNATQEASAVQSFEPASTQVLDWSRGGKRQGAARTLRSGGLRAPGTLVRVRTLNSIETFETAPVHAQIIDFGLGEKNYGATLLGDASADSTFERIKIVFHRVKDRDDPRRSHPIAARALSLGGVLGVPARKHGSLAVRSALSASQGGIGEALQTDDKTKSAASILVRLLIEGLGNEMGADVGVAQKQNLVLQLDPGTEFFAEVTEDFSFGGGAP